MKTLSRILLLCTLAGGLSSCNEDYSSSVPSTTVNFICDLLQGHYSVITTPGQFITVTKNENGSGYVVRYPGRIDYEESKQGIYLGFGGLIIGYPTISMEVSSQYVAYDRACPIEAADLEISRLDINTLGEGKCPRCGTVYDLNSGFPKESKYENGERLRTYTVYTSNSSGSTMLTVRN